MTNIVNFRKRTLRTWGRRLDLLRKSHFPRIHNICNVLKCRPKPNCLTLSYQNILYPINKKSYFIIVVQVIPHLLFSKFDVENLHCEVCELSKQKQIPFPISNKRGNSPFYLIQTDIQGPSNVSNISGARWFVTFIDIHNLLGYSWSSINLMSTLFSPTFF